MVGCRSLLDNVKPQLLISNYTHQGSTCGEYGRVAAVASAARASATPKGRTQPKAFPVSGAESVLAFVRKSGNPTTAQIRQHWNSEGRGGTGKTVLSKLVTDKKLKREPLQDGRGSRYKIA